MQGLAARLGESRIAQALLAAAVLGGLLVLAVLREPDRMQLVGPAERARSAALFDSWLAASRAERCERPALRTPTTGDGRGDYPEFVARLEPDRTTPLAACRETLRKVRDQVEKTCTRGPCPLVPLGQLRPHPEVLERCAGLFDVIERHAHTTRSCSPIAPEYAMLFDLPAFSLFDVPRAVRLEIAALVARGALGDAARAVTNAMLFVADYGRDGAIVSVMSARAAEAQLLRTVDELLADPRLTAGDARAIVRDLDIVRSVPMRFDHVMRAEILAMTTYLDTIEMAGAGLTGDRQQDRALMILAHERWLALYDRTCSDATLAVCVAKLRAIHAIAPADIGADYQPLLHSSWDPDLVRERVIDQLVGTRQLFDEYAQRMAMSDAWLAAVRARAAARAAQP